MSLKSSTLKEANTYEVEVTVDLRKDDVIFFERSGVADGLDERGLPRLEDRNHALTEADENDGLAGF